MKVLIKDVRSIADLKSKLGQEFVIKQQTKKRMRVKNKSTHFYIRHKGSNQLNANIKPPVWWGILLYVCLGNSISIKSGDNLFDENLVGIYHSESFELCCAGIIRLDNPFCATVKRIHD